MILLYRGSINKCNYSPFRLVMEMPEHENNSFQYFNIIQNLDSELENCMTCSESKLTELKCNSHAKQFR